MTVNCPTPEIGIGERGIVGKQHCRAKDAVGGNRPAVRNHGDEVSEQDGPNYEQDNERSPSHGF